MYTIHTLLARTVTGELDQQLVSYAIRYRGFTYDPERKLIIQRTRFQPQVISRVWELPEPGRPVRLSEIVPVEEQACGAS